jgi:hypothetical protein
LADDDRCGSEHGDDATDDDRSADQVVGWPTTPRSGSRLGRSVVDARALRVGIGCSSDLIVEEVRSGRHRCRS